MRRTLLNAGISIASLLLCAAMVTPSARAGSIFLTGHDPDFHAQSGGGENPTGAQHINSKAIQYILDGAFNPYSASAHKFLMVESNIAVPSGHRRGTAGIALSGYAEGVDFEQHNATDLGAELSLLGTKYSGIVVASDFGGILTSAELDILTARSGDIINFLNGGGGLYAMGESNGGAGLTPNGHHFGYLPFVVTSTPLNQGESGNALSAFGSGLGLLASDVNGNFSHNVFDNDAGLNVVDTDPAGHILSIAGRAQIDDHGVVPENGTLLMLGLGLGGLAACRLGRRA